MDTVRQIIFYKHYFDEFFAGLAEKVKDKIDEVLFMITILERIPTKFFKSIEGAKGLFEIRIEYESNTFRIFCCFDKGNLLVLFNGFQKKSQKAPAKEIDRAVGIMQNYFSEQKEKNNERKG